VKTVAEMAREVKMPYDFETGEPINLEKLKAFADLVRADEREACAKVCEDDAWRCKKIAVETQNKKANAAALEAYMCAEAIRARGAKHDPA